MLKKPSLRWRQKIVHRKSNDNTTQGVTEWINFLFILRSTEKLKHTTGTNTLSNGEEKAHHDQVARMHIQPHTLGLNGFAVSHTSKLL